MAKDLFQLDDGSSDSAFARIGIFGPTGSGKSTLGAMLAIGLHKLIKSKRPITVFETEGKYRCLRPLFEDAGIKPYLVQSHAFADLKAVMFETPKHSDILLIDQLSHPWSEVQAAYKTTKGKTTFITIRGWQSIKGLWNEGFNHPYMTAKMHIIWLSRLANIFVEEEEDKIAQTGVKPKTETDASYEPDVLVQLVMDRQKRSTKGNWTPRAIVIKDNYSGPNSLMGKEFEWPTFENFLPYFQNLRLGGEHQTVDLSRTSVDEFDEAGRTEWERRKRQREAALEEVKELLSVTFGTGRDDKKLKAVIVLALFGTLAWDNEIVPDARKHPLEECLVAASAVRSLVKKMQDPEFLKGLTPESVEGWIRDFKVGGGAFEHGETVSE